LNERVYNREITRLRDPERVERLEIERVVELALEGHSFRSVLDVGTGSGLFAEAFAQRGLAVSGIDIKEEMISAAGEFVPEGEFKIGQAEHLPYEDASFDLVYLGLVLHEADDALEALKESRRVARSRAAILEWRYAVEDFGPPLEHRLAAEIITSMANRAGFQSVEAISLKCLILYRLE